MNRSENLDRLGNMLSRRDLLRRAFVLGLSAPVVASLLAACGDDDDDDDGNGAVDATPTEAEDEEPSTEADGDATGTEAGDEASPTEDQGDATATDAGATETKPAAGGEVTDVRLALDWFPWAQHSGLYLAYDRGYFEDEGLNVTIEVQANPEDGIRLAGTGEVAFAITYQADTLIARGQEIPVVSVAALVQHPLNAIMFRAELDIERPADLEGRSIGYAGLPSDEALMQSVLASDGLTLDDVEMVNVGFSLAPALISGQVDAVIGAYPAYETFQIEQQGQEVDNLLLTDWGVPDYYELVVVSGEEMIENEPDVIQRFINAVVRGYDAAEAEPQAAIDALLANNPDASREIEEASIDELTTYWTDEGAVTFGTQTAENWQRYADWLKESDLLADDVDPVPAFTNEFVEAAE